MRGIIGIFIVGIIACVGAVMMMKKSAAEDSIAIAMGFGEGKDNQIEMNSVVGNFLVMKDPVRVDRVTGRDFPDEWVEEHFQLFDSNRQRVPLMRLANSSIIPDSKSGANVWHFLGAKLNVGEEYTYEYVPKKNEKTRYRMVFTAPAAKDTWRKNFMLVE